MKTLESIQKFLQDLVCSKIKLKKPNDKNVDLFELVNPNAFIMNFPSKNHLPEGIESIIPCLVVCFEEGSDDSKTSDINIRIILVVYSPGFHKSNEENEVECTADGEGWRDLINFIDTTKAAIQSNQILNGITVQYPIKWGVYQKEDQAPELDPYFYGWITFSVSGQSYPAAEMQKLLL
jgi:hypothetical protein